MQNLTTLSRLNNFRKINKILIFVIILLCISISSIAGNAPPARIGGSVAVNGVKLTHATSAGYFFRVTGKDGKGFTPPAEDYNGLNKRDKYIIDIPIYNPASKSEGAKPESTAVIHVYINGEELKVEKPFRGEFTVGKEGTITPIDLVISR
jgi:hypothetical protein